MINQLTVVIIAYNRANSLKRLLGSLSKANLKDYELSLMFSLEKDSTDEVLTLANHFSLGGKKAVVRISETFLGADKHNMLVQKLALEHENILILEDDHFVSPQIFDFAFKALNFFTSNENIAGISLYPYLTIESRSIPFIPIQDGFDNYFQQRPSSRGLILTKAQIQKYDLWASNKASVDIDLPPNVQKWKEDNWEKKWYKYLIETNQYVVFPRMAFNTVFGDLGFNVKNPIERYEFQQSLCMFQNEFKFIPLNESRVVYDAFYELLTYHIIGYNDIEGNIYNTKNIQKIKRKYVVISGVSPKSIQRFGGDLKPKEMNVILQVDGEELSIILSKDLIATKENYFYHYLYYHGYKAFPSIKVWLMYLIQKTLTKLTKRFTS